MCDASNIIALIYTKLVHTIKYRPDRLGHKHMNERSDEIIVNSLSIVLGIIGIENAYENRAFSN